MKAAVFATDPQNRNQNLVNSICNAFAVRLGASNLFRPGYRDLVSTCQENEIDLLVVFGGAGAIQGPLERALSLVKTSVLWTAEDPYEIDRNVEVSELFDFVFSNDSSTVKRYRNALGCLPFAADPDLHDFEVRERDEDFLFDLFFAGSAWPNRVASVNGLLEHLPRDLRYKIGIFGNQFLPDRTINDLNLITNFRVAPREFARMANASLVNLTLDRSFSGATPDPVHGDTPPPRLFELALAGTAQVYVSTRSGASQYFEPGREILIVPDIKSAAGAIMDIIKDGSLRRSLAQASRRRALTDHLYTNRVDAILAAVKQRAGDVVRASSPSKPAALPEKRRVLIVTHNKLGSKRGYGGVELYQQTLVDGLKGRDYEFLYFYPDTEGGFVLCDDTDTQVTRFGVPYNLEDTVSCPGREALFARVLQSENIGLVHFHHLLGHPLSLPLIARSLGVPSVFHAHDYFGVCTEFNLLGIRGAYCDIPDNKTEVCDVCLSSRGIAPPGAQARRRLVFSEAFKHIDRVLHPSQYGKNKFISIYPEIDPGKHVVMGSSGKPDTFHRINEQKRRSRRANERLQVAILGNFTEPKGGNLLMAMFPLLVNDAMDFHIFGRVDANFEPPLSNPNLTNVFIHGEFAQSELGLKLRDMDVSVHFSIWPETYCIAVDEARAAGIFPIVLGYGALAARVESWKDGIVVDPQRPFDLIHVLRRLVVDRSALEKFDFKVSQLQDNYDRHIDAVERIYAELIAARRCAPVTASADSGRSLLASDFDRRFNSRQWQVFEVEADEQLHGISDLCLYIEAAKNTMKPLSKLAGAIKVADVLLPELDDAVLCVDEIQSALITRKVISLNRTQSRLALGVSLPAGSDVQAVDLILEGAAGWRTALSEELLGHRDREWNVASVALGSIPSGIYQVLVGVRFDGRIAYYGSGIQIRIGGGDMAAPAPRISRNADASQRRAHADSRAKARRGAANGTIGRRVSSFARSAVEKVTRKTLKFNVDKVQGTLFKFGGVKVNSRTSLSIEGWCVAPQLKPCAKVSLTLRSGDKARRVDTSPVSRPDLAKHFKSPLLANAGFRGVYPAKLSPGIYTIEVNATVGNGRVMTVQGGSFEVV